MTMMDGRTDSPGASARGPFRREVDIMNPEPHAGPSPSSTSEHSRKRRHVSESEVGVVGTGVEGGSGSANAAVGHGAHRRTRGTYTSVACDGCKKRKLKCITVENKASCERCLTNHLLCQYTHAQDIVQLNKGKGESLRQYHTVKAELAQLRIDFAELSQFVKSLSDRVDTAYPSHDGKSEKPAPKQPQFMGPMRAAYGFALGHDSLTSMGIPQVEEPVSSRSPSPSVEGSQKRESEPEFWLRCTPEEVLRLIKFFEDEIGCLYPFLDFENIANLAPEALREIQYEERRRHRPSMGVEPLHFAGDHRDVIMVKMIVSCALNLESETKTDLATAIMDPIEKSLSCIAGPESDLKQIQLITVLSSYYFHADEDLLAWRSNGVAARGLLEMGLHRSHGFVDNFSDLHERQLAIRTFWCIYLLDRRYSFGTGLPFALTEIDIDPDVPKPDAEFSYLNCMIGYGLLCSRIWSAVTPYRSPSSFIPNETVSFLDQHTLDWIETTPEHLKLHHPRSQPAPQPKILHRLRAMLHLRGNNTRILIYRQYLFSAASLAAEPESSRLVVDIAKDTVEVLVHLNKTTDIYSRQQSNFNYFLIGALSTLFLAVCHGPKMFKDSCRQSFTDAVELVRGFHKHNTGSRRLWENIQATMVRLRRLVTQIHDQNQPLEERRLAVSMNVNPSINNDETQFDGRNQAVQALTQEDDALRASQTPPVMTASSMYNKTVEPPFSNFLQLSDNVLDLFEVFGQWEDFPAGLGDEAPQQQQQQQQQHSQQQQQQQLSSHFVGQDFSGATNWDGGGAFPFPGFV